MLTDSSEATCSPSQYELDTSALRFNAPKSPFLFLLAYEYRSFVTQSKCLCADLDTLRPLGLPVSWITASTLQNTGLLHARHANDHFSGRTAPLTSRCCILYIYSTNIRTEYFKHAAYSPFFPLQNVVYFIMLPFFGSCIIHNLYTGCAKI